MSLKTSQVLDRDNLNRSYLSKTATGTQIFQGSLRMLGSLTLNDNAALNGKIRFNNSIGILMNSTSSSLSVETAGSSSTLTIGRTAGYASIKAGGTANGKAELVLESTGGGVYLNNYATDSVYIVNGGGKVGIGTTDFAWATSDNNPVTATGKASATLDANKVFVNGSIQLMGTQPAIVLGRSGASFLTDEELGFGWGGGWYMQDGTYLRVRNNKHLHSTGDATFGGNLYVGGQATMASGSKIRGTGTGVANGAWLGFYDSDGTTRRGYVGDESTGNYHIGLSSDSGDVNLSAGGARLLLSRDSGVIVTGSLDVDGEIKHGMVNEFPDPLIASKGSWSGVNGTWSFDSAQKPTGTGASGSIKIVPTAADAYAYYGHYFDVNPNEWITFSSYVFSTVSGRISQLYIQWLDSAKATLTSGGHVSNQITNTAVSWTRYSLTAQAPSGARYFRVRIDNDGYDTTTNATMYFSAFQVERGRAMTGFIPYSGGNDISLSYDGTYGRLNTPNNSGILLNNSNNIILGDSSIKVGVGTTSPSERLDVAGSIQSTQLGRSFMFKKTTASTGNQWVGWYDETGAENAWLGYGSSNNWNFGIFNNKGPIIMSSSSKKVGILTTSVHPDADIDLNGKVKIATFSTADTDEWPNLIWLRDTTASWDEGLIKGSSTKHVNGKAGFGIHFHSSRAFSFFSSSWTRNWTVEHGGHVNQAGSLYAGGDITSAANIYTGGAGNYHRLRVANVPFSSVNGDDLVIRSLSQFRFSDSANWAWNDWGGIAYRNGTKTIHIGGPAGSVFSANASPPMVNVAFDGVRKVGINNASPNTHLWISGFGDGGSAFYLDEDRRANLALRSQYPELNIWSSGVTNTSHGPTIRLGGYLDTTQSTWKHWVIGTAATSPDFIDIGYGENSTNPHVGIANYNEAGAKIGYTVMRLTKDKRVGINTISPSYTLDVSGNARVTSSLLANGDMTVSKGNAWLTLHSTSASDVNGGAGVSIGESGYKGGATLHLTYTHDGYGHIGMGVVDSVTNLPQYEAIRLYYLNNVTQILGTLDMNNNYITEVRRLYGQFGLVMRSEDEWLRINDPGEHTSGVYFGTSVVRTDGELQVGSSGGTFRANSSGMSTSGNMSASGKNHALGASSSWDDYNYNNFTTLKVQGHNQFWLGAGNSTWYSGTATTGHHDLLLTTMVSQTGYTRGITFTAQTSGAVPAAGTAYGYRLGRWFSGTSNASSSLVVDGSFYVKAGSNWGTESTTTPVHVHLAIGDNDTGFFWNSDGDISLRTNGATQMRYNTSQTYVYNHLWVDSNVSLNSGHGRGYRFWNSDSYKIYMSASNDANWGGNVPWIPFSSTDTDYNTYFRMESNNRGWAFRNGTQGGINAQIEGNGRFHSKKGYTAGGTNGRASMEWNDTEQSLDFVFY